MDISSIKELLNNPIIWTGVFITMMGSVFYSLKGIPEKILKTISTQISIRLIYTARVYEYDDLFNLFESYLQRNHQKEYRDVEARLFSAIPSSEENTKSPMISYNQSVNVFTLVINGKRIFITKQREKLEYAQSFRSLYGYHYSIKGFTAKTVITHMLQQIVDEHYAALPQNQVRIMVNDKYGNWDNFNSITVKDLSKIIIDPEKKRHLIEDLQKFNDSKDWYTRLSIPYKRMYCFEGQPGTGKTSISMAIAAHRNDAAMQDAYKNLPNNSVLIIEDIDSVFTKREGAQNVSFSCLLNSTDGAFYKEGLITCITTNHIDRLDPALLRPGRTDMILHIGYPKVKQIEEYLSLFYGFMITIDCDCEDILLPMSAIQEICISNRNDSFLAVTTIKSQLLLKSVFA